MSTEAVLSGVSLAISDVRQNWCTDLSEESIVTDESATTSKDSLVDYPPESSGDQSRNKGQDQLSATQLEVFPKPEHRELKTVGDFIMMLGNMDVPGPLIITDPLDEGRKLGEGAQFSVYRNTILRSHHREGQTDLIVVAVKKCNFGVLQGNELVDLSSTKFRAQVRHMRLEIAALQDARLRRHRNIVKLMGWGMDIAWHKSPLLVLELAIADLHMFLEMPTDDRTSDVPHQLVLDTGSGLDAIHGCSISHGDLKPENVLVFRGPSERVPFVAKLSDFGLSVDEATEDANCFGLIKGHSYAWSAPEIRKNLEQDGAQAHEISMRELLKADNYSYGLLALSCLCLSGAVPTLNDGASTEGIVHNAALPQSLRSVLSSTLDSLLDPNHCKRPALVGHLLKDHSRACQDWSVIPS